jgi:hypothetical protein
LRCDDSSTAVRAFPPAIAPGDAGNGREAAFLADQAIDAARP